MYIFFFIIGFYYSVKLLGKELKLVKSNVLLQQEGLFSMLLEKAFRVQGSHGVSTFFPEISNWNGGVPRLILWLESYLHLNIAFRGLNLL